jgi:hypothetical protein
MNHLHHDVQPPPFKLGLRLDGLMASFLADSSIVQACLWDLKRF